MVKGGDRVMAAAGATRMVVESRMEVIGRGGMTRERILNINLVLLAAYSPNTTTSAAFPPLYELSAA